MIATIEIRRGLFADLPVSGSLGEPFFATDTGQLFVWNGSAMVAIGGGGSSAGATRHYSTSPPNGSRTVFPFTGAALSNLNFQFFRNGILQDENNDYTIAIAGGITTVTILGPAPASGDTLVAFF